MHLSWKGLTSRLEELEKTLGQVTAPCDAAGIPEWIAMLSFRDLAGVDAILLEMLRRNHWQEMDDRQCAQIHLRLTHALEFCRAAKQGALADIRQLKGRPPWKEEAEALDSLLLEFWWRTACPPV